MSHELFQSWARAVLALHHSRQPSEVYQTSTMNALLAGIYDGDVTIAELLTHGDFGLGTFNHLDGEMVVIDGVCYHLRADGSAAVASPEDKTPFAAVLRFHQDIALRITSPTDQKALTDLVDQAIPSPNLMYGLRVEGTFVRVRTRTAMAQKQPYPPLAEATADQSVTQINIASGTVAGFRTPAYEQGISVAGYHLHFLTDDRSRGGHALDFELRNGEVRISTASELHVSLPRRGPFLSAELPDRGIDTQIRQVEGD